MTATQPHNQKDSAVGRIFDELTDFAVQHDFAGYSKHDGLNSPILQALACHNRWLRLLVIQSIMRSPINLRPLLLTEKSRNPKGIALFVKGYLGLYAMTRQEQYRTLAEDLLAWLMEHHSNQDRRFAGYCWGYNFIWQSPFFYAPKYFPNITVTVFAGEAFALGYQILKQNTYLQIALSAAEYILQDLPILYATPTELCLGYVSADVTEQVININALAAAFLSKLYALTHTARFKEQAIKLINFVVHHALDDNRWTYTTDRQHSYVDNYHTGGIIDSMLETMESLDYWAWQATLMNAVRYYQSFLFTSAGAPKHRDNRTYPHDIHGAAQGIITFSKMSRLDPNYLDLAENILDWTLHNLYSGKGYFYYQKMRWFTKKFTFMRWCNAWMLYALAEFLQARHALKPGANDVDRNRVKL